MTAAVQGFGNVAQYAVKLFTEYGGKVICVSCWDNADQKTYTFRKMDGLTYEELIGITDKFGTIDKVKAKSLGYEILPGDAWIEQEVDVLIPAAIENQVTGENVNKISKRVKIIAEGANGPTTPEADKVLEAARHLRHPRLPLQRRRRELQLLRAGPGQHELLLAEGRGAHEAGPPDDQRVPRRGRPGEDQEALHARRGVRDRHQPRGQRLPAARLGVGAGARD